MLLKKFGSSKKFLGKIWKVDFFLAFEDTNHGIFNSPVVRPKIQQGHISFQREGHGMACDCIG